MTSRLALSLVAVFLGFACQNASGEPEEGRSAESEGAVQKELQTDPASPREDGAEEEGESEPSAATLECDGDAEPCEGQCRDLRDDHRHCGACGHSCADGEVCKYGECLTAEAPAVTAGRRHSCALGVDGAVECWGWSRHGVTNPPEATFRQIDAGEFNNCGITDEGAINCWGSDAWNVSQPPTGEFQRVVVGKYHACAIDADGGVACWGQSRSVGRVPDGRFRHLSAGQEHTCGIRADDTVTCWGSNDYGQLREIPDGHVRALDAGGYETCAVGDDGQTVCWSDPVQAHRERRARRIREMEADGDEGGPRCGGAIPPKLGESPPDADLRELATGRGHACGVKTDGRLVCWGAEFPDLPSQRFRTIDSSIAHYCGVTTDDELLCWGNAGNGRTAVPDEFS